MSRHATYVCHTMPCHVMSCHVMPCHVMPCHVMPCHFMSCHLIVTCRIPNPDKSQAGRDGAAHGGTVGRGGDGQDGTPTGRFAQETPSLLPSRRSKTMLLGVSLEARTKGTLCKPMGEQSPRLTRGLSAV